MGASRKAWTTPILRKSFVPSPSLFRSLVEEAIVVEPPQLVFALLFAGIPQG